MLVVPSQAASASPPAVAAAAAAAPASTITSCGIGSADAVSSVSGTIRGASSGCYADRSIKFFWHQGGISAVQKSPYRGDVLATAYDGDSYTYVVYVDVSKKLRLGRMSDSGKATQSVVLSAANSYFTADLVAAHGKYWVVWSEQVGSTGQQELFARRTLNGAKGKTRITTTSSNVQDYEPSVAYSAGRLTLVWTRGTTTGSDLRVARSTGGSWAASTFASTGKFNSNADVAIAAGKTYVVWTRDGKIVLRDNSGGAYRSKQFGTPSWNAPSVAVSAGKVYVSWTLDSPEQVYLARKVSGTWQGKVVNAGPAAAISAVAAGGSGQVVYKTPRVIAVVGF
ncbi:hypothetical protein D1871_14115 [Nakamurella silvestris]|nr:hypothetical protein D1871_14115 [Nakamurella silvestris]